MSNEILTTFQTGRPTHDPAIGYASSMKPITDWDKLDGKTSADEFRRQHATQANLTLEEFDRYLVVEPCDDEVGWAAVPRTLVRREQLEARRKRG